MSLRVCNWKHGKRWVYSVTYDEALADLYRFVVPVHEEYGFPGHVEVMVGQLGQIRDLPGSSYHGMRHANADELKDLLRRGWGVGNHSWSHQLITQETVDREIREAREVLETAIESPVVLYCSPGDNTNMSDHVLDACRRFGYLGAMSITDAPNDPKDKLFWLNRTPLHHELYGPFFSKFDPFRNIRMAQEQNGWIIDYCHCPLEEAIHPNKDCSVEELRRRFEAVLSEGSDEVWCAMPDEVLFYHNARKHIRIDTVSEAQIYRLRFEGLHDRVFNRELTFEFSPPTSRESCFEFCARGERKPMKLTEHGHWLFTLVVEDDMEITFPSS